MDKTLVIYDFSGKVWCNITGNYDLPSEGVLFLEIQIPDGKLIKKVDTSVTPHLPVLEDLPIPEVVSLKERVELLEGVINELLGIS